MKYYIGPFQWKVDALVPGMEFFTAPDNSQLLFDLRNTSQMSIKNTKNGYGIFYAADNIVLSPEYELLGTGNDIKDINITVPKVSMIQTKLGFRPNGRKLHHILEELVLDYADPDGVSACKPLLPANRKFVFNNVFESVLDWNNPRGKKVISLLKKDLDRQRDESLSKGNTAYRKLMQVNIDEYGLDFDTLRPAKWSASEKPAKPETTITETFDKADGVGLGPLLTWTNAIGAAHNWRTLNNKAAPPTTGSSAARAESLLSGANHYSKIGSSSTNVGLYIIQFGPCTRFASNAVTYYMVLFYRWSSTINLYIYRTVTGTASALVHLPISSTLVDTAFTIKCDSTGSTQSSYINDGLVSSIVDTAITGNLYTGLFGFKASGQSFWEGADNYEASDGISSGVIRTIPRRRIITTNKLKTRRRFR